MARSSASRLAVKGSPSLAHAPASKGAPKPAAASAEKPKEGWRETVDAIVVAGILALLVRTFEVEAFVIPTGSMAPTLMGRHKEITCPQCGFVYTVNAADEVEGYSDGAHELPRVRSGTCVNCRFQSEVDKEVSFKGDRILVLKFPYDLPSLPGSSPPSRWDVVVFHYPEKPEENYIKRLIGLPGETLRIWYGDIFIKPPGSPDFQIARKPLEHQRAMQVMVYDDSHRPDALKDRQEWRRWVPAAASDWTEDKAKPGVFIAAHTGDDWAELRYRHVVPDPVQWNALIENEAGEPLPRPPQTTLITDFYSYNTNVTGDVRRDQDSAWLQPHWVGDLTISSRVTSAGSAGALRFELIEGGISNRCEFDLATGATVIYHGDDRLGRAITSVKGPGTHDVEFANVDNRLSLQVDGARIFGDGLTYEDDAAKHPESTPADLAPARIAARGNAMRVSDLVLKRDIYYTLRPVPTDYANSWDTRMPRSPVELFAFLADPTRVAALGPLSWSDFPIGKNSFMMMGDNSPRSRDGRAWDTIDRYNPDLDPEDPSQGWDKSGRQSWEVPRNLLIGKAFCIYWPHGKPFWPNLQPIKDWPDFRIPFRPYFERMKLIH
jgi:signal peptidase I